ncbi:MAG: formylglycine-generating enzyme family protein [Bacteroidetes bacterium]|nr:MAG: formylglycine-generating enzyme family protein [Bacteroidota bacterium]
MSGMPAHIKSGLLCLLLGGLIHLPASAQTAEKSYTESIPGTAVRFDMVFVPAGKVSIGTPDSEEGHEADESPQRQVALDSFWMGRFEVTYDMYDIFRDKKKDNDTTRRAQTPFKADAVTRPSPPYEDPTFGMGTYGYPAVSMTQYAALRFCKWLWEKTGQFYRLPTEAEWEYACRAGSQSAYSFGDNVADLGTYAWYYDNSNSAYHKVGTKKPNAWGLYDMHGNVAEWTLDQYQADFLAKLGDSLNVNPWQKPVKLHPRTVRGGSWDDDAEELRSGNRIQSSMEWKRRDPQLPKSFWWNTDSPFVGFRLVRPARPMSDEEVRNFWKAALDE